MKTTNSKDLLLNQWSPFQWTISIIGACANLTTVILAFTSTVLPWLIAGMGIVGSVLLIWALVNSTKSLRFSTRSKAGIKRISFNNNDILINYIKKQEDIRCIKIIATAANILLENIQIDIIKKLAENPDVTIKVLVANPKSTYLKDLGKLEKHNISEGIADIAKGKLIGYLAQAKEAANLKNVKNIGSCHLKYFNTECRAAITIVNNKWAWYTPYLPPNIVPNSISYELIDKGEASLLAKCIKHFDAIWNNYEEEPLE
jgi:hypothetical protein